MTNEKKPPLPKNLKGRWAIVIAFLAVLWGSAVEGVTAGSLHAAIVKPIEDTIKRALHSSEDAEDKVQNNTFNFGLDLPGGKYAYFSGATFVKRPTQTSLVVTSLDGVLKNQELEVGRTDLREFFREMNTRVNVCIDIRLLASDPLAKQVKLVDELSSIAERYGNGICPTV